MLNLEASEQPTETPMAKSEQIIFRTTPEQRAALEQIATDEERSLSWMIVRLLDEALAARKPRRKK